MKTFEEQLNARRRELLDNIYKSNADAIEARETKLCEDCDGTGRYGDGKHDGSGRWVECPFCGGDGRRLRISDLLRAPESVQAWANAMPAAPINESMTREEVIQVLECLAENSRVTQLIYGRPAPTAMKLAARWLKEEGK